MNTTTFSLHLRSGRTTFTNVFRVLAAAWLLPLILPFILGHVITDTRGLSFALLLLVWFGTPFMILLRLYLIFSVRWPTDTIESFKHVNQITRRNTKVIAILAFVGTLFYGMLFLMSINEVIGEIV